MAYKLAIPEHTELQIDKCISYIVNTLRNPTAAEAILDDIEHAYDLLLGKFPASKGRFYKTIVAGHVGTGSRYLANDCSYHDVYYDGESHYYIDGPVYKGGKLLLLGYDENDGKYYQIESNRRIPVRKYEEYVS